MAKAIVLCQDCGEIFTDEETKEHQKTTGHNHWTLCYGASLMLILWRWVIMSRTEYLSLALENEALRKKVLKQADIIADTKSKMMPKIRVIE